MKLLNNRLKLFEKKKGEYNSAIGSLISELQKYCDFEISHNDFAGDGLSIMSTANDGGFRRTPTGVPVEAVIRIIKEKGLFTLDDFDANCSL